MEVRFYGRRYILYLNYRLLDSHSLSCFLGFNLESFLISGYNKRNLSMQKDAEQKFMLSFVDMGCQVKFVDVKQTLHS